MGRRMGGSTLLIQYNTPVSMYTVHCTVHIRTDACILHTLFGYRCNQLPLIEKLPQWLSGPSSPLSVTAGPPVGNRTRFKWCSDAQYFYSTISIDDINAQSGWSLKTEKIRINNMYTSDTTHTIRHLFLTWTSLYPSLHFLKLNPIICGTPAYFLLTLTCVAYLNRTKAHICLNQT